MDNLSGYHHVFQDKTIFGDAFVRSRRHLAWCPSGTVFEGDLPGDFPGGWRHYDTTERFLENFGSFSFLGLDAYK